MKYFGSTSEHSRRMPVCHTLKLNGLIDHSKCMYHTQELNGLIDHSKRKRMVSQPYAGIKCSTSEHSKRRRMVSQPYAKTKCLTSSHSKRKRIVLRPYAFFMIRGKIMSELMKLALRSTCRTDYSTEPKQCQKKSLRKF